MSGGQTLAGYLLRAPILSRLPRQALARLAVNLEERRCRAGEEIFAQGEAATHLYLILEGEVEVRCGGRIDRVERGFLGEEAVLGQPAHVHGAIALSPTRLLVLDGAAAVPILEAHPEARHEFVGSLLRLQRQTSDGNDASYPLSLRVRAGVRGYKGQGNSLSDPLTPTPLPGGEGLSRGPLEDDGLLRHPPGGEGPSRSPNESPGDKPHLRTDTTAFFGWLLALLLPVALYRLPWLADVPADTRTFVSVFSVTILMWVFKLVPDFVAGLLSVLVVLVLGIAPTGVILGGFRSSSFFMAMSIFVLAGVVVSSGLIYRMSLNILKRTPPSRFLYNLMLTLTALASTPILPSVNGRVGLLTPLLSDFIGVLGFRREGPDATRLATSAFFGASLFSAVFMTSKSINFVVLGMLPGQIQDSFHWLNWCLAAAVAGLTSLLLLLLLSFLFFPSGERPRLSETQVQTQLDILGRMSGAEWGAIAGVLLLVAGIATTSLHKIQPAWIGLSLMFLFLAVGTMEKNDFRRKIDWPFLFLLGTLIGLARTIHHLGLDQMIGAHLSDLGRLMHDDIYLFVPVLAGLVFLLRFAVSINAAVVITVPILLPLAETAGINSWVICFMVLTLSEAFALPYQCSYYLQLRSSNERLGLYREHSFLQFNLLTILIRMAAIYASIPFWRALEILQ